MFWLLFSYSPARRYCLLHKNCPRQQLRALVCVEIGISEKPEFSFLFVCLYKTNIRIMSMLYKQTNKKENSGFWLVKSGHVTCRMPLSAFKFKEDIKIE